MCDLRRTKCCRYLLRIWNRSLFSLLFATGFHYIRITGSDSQSSFEDIKRTGQFRETGKGVYIYFQPSLSLIQPLILHLPCWHTKIKKVNRKKNPTFNEVKFPYLAYTSRSWYYIYRYEYICRVFFPSKYLIIASEPARETSIIVFQLRSPNNEAGLYVLKMLLNGCNRPRVIIKANGRNEPRLRYEKNINLCLNIVSVHFFFAEHTLAFLSLSDNLWKWIARREYTGSSGFSRLLTWNFVKSQVFSFLFLALYEILLRCTHWQPLRSYHQPLVGGACTLAFIYHYYIHIVRRRCF